MLALQHFDVLAVRAAINALVIAWARTPKGRRRLREAIDILQAQAMYSQVSPIDRRLKTLDPALLTEGVEYLLTLKDMIDEGKV